MNEIKLCDIVRRSSQEGSVASLPKQRFYFMKQNFAAIILGGTGQVGGAAVTELVAIPECREVVMITKAHCGAIAGAQRRS